MILKGEKLIMENVSDILGMVGIVVGIIGVVVTVTIFCVQNAQNNREKKAREILILQNELLRCKNWCDELKDYNWYNDMKFSETEKELEYHISLLKNKVLFFKCEKYIYMERYNAEILNRIIYDLGSMEILIRLLIEKHNLQNAFIEHHFRMGNPHDENGWELYNIMCVHIRDQQKRFGCWGMKLNEDLEYLERELKRMKFFRSDIKLSFGEVDLELLQKKCEKCDD